MKHMIFTVVRSPRHTRRLFLTLAYVGYHDCQNLFVSFIHTEFGRWKLFLRFQDAATTAAVEAIPSLVTDSKARSTNVCYMSAIRRFKIWAINVPQARVFPTDDITLAIYVITIMQEGSSIAMVNTTIAAMKWAHSLAELEDPTDSIIFKTILYGIKRASARPVTRKEPIDVELLADIHENMFPTGDYSNILNVRNFTMFLISYAGFLRFDDLSNISICDLMFCDDYMRIKVHRSKTDQYRAGDEIFIARTFSRLCPVAWIERYLELTGQNKFSPKFLFRALRFDKRQDRIVIIDANNKISYTRVREVLRQALVKVGRDPNVYGLHSLRAGGVTAAVMNGISRRLYKLHGRWSSDAVDSYIKDTLRSRLQVTKNLGL